MRWNRVITGVMAAALLCAGCDGVYMYSYEGKLYQHDGTTPARGVPLMIFAEPGQEVAKDDPIWQYVDARTDQSGHFAGSFAEWTGWLFPIRPAAPKLDRVYLLVPSTHPIEIPVAGAGQKMTPMGREIPLPPIVLPEHAGVSN